MTYGFIITRHVNSELTNRYWNECIRCIRRLYPFRKIVVIDDNSNKQFIKADFDYKNVEYIQSDYPQRGELLPYFYLVQRAFFDNAIILHDSVFIEKRIMFEKLEENNVNVLPLWHFSEEKTENIENTLRIASILKNNKQIMEALKDPYSKKTVLGLHADAWSGCFGVQSYINLKFLTYLRDKYGLFRLLKVVHNRADRCSLERIMGAIFSLEYPVLVNKKSLLGSIQHPSMKWGYTYQQHREHMTRTKRSDTPFVKVWSGR